MTTYGFRLFRFTVHQGQKRKEQDLVVHEDGKAPWRYVDHLHSAAAAREGTSNSGHPPKPDGSPYKSYGESPVFELRKVIRGGGHLAGAFRFGRDGGHEWAYPIKADDDRDPVDIEGMAPARRYRFAMLFPDSGNEGVLMLESVGGACPYQSFMRWVRYWSQQATVGTDDAWYRMKVTPIADKDQVDEFLKGARVDELVLSSEKASRSRRISEKGFKLTTKLDASSKRAALSKLTTAIAAGKPEDELADDFAKLVGGGVDALDFEDAWLHVDSPTFGSQTISPSRLPEVFTYRIGTERPDEDVLHQEVKSRLRKLDKVPAVTTIKHTGWPTGVDDV